MSVELIDGLWVSRVFRAVRLPVQGSGFRVWGVWGFGFRGSG